MPADRPKMAFTRARDLATVAVLAVVGGYVLVRLSYQRIPPLPSLAGLAAAVLGAAEAITGWGFRSRIMAVRDADGRPRRPPVPSLTAARAVLTAKATSLAGAALVGLWLAVLLYVGPLSGQIAAAGHDLTAGVIGVAGSAAMVGGALFLEHCLRAPADSARPPDGRRPGR